MTDFQKCNINENETELKKLWLSSFEDEVDALDLFFKRNKSAMSVYCAFAGNKIISALYLLPCTINGKNSHYLCGASTDINFRGRGIMSALIEYALKSAKESGDYYSALFPANEKLYSFYSKLGYEQKCTAIVNEISRKSLEKLSLQTNENFNNSDKISALQTEKNSKNTDKTSILQDEIHCTVLQNKVFGKDFLLYNAKFIAFARDYYRIYGVQSIETESCFALVEETDKATTVIYSLFNDFSVLAKELLKKSKAQNFVFVNKATNCDKAVIDKKFIDYSKTVKYGMLKALNCKTENADIINDIKNCKTDIPDDVFIGLTLN